jgi:ribulose 1,5-bisphosphate synthetase/thiazole synthase
MASIDSKANSMPRRFHNTSIEPTTLDGQLTVCCTEHNSHFQNFATRSVLRKTGKQHLASNLWGNESLGMDFTGTSFGD